MSFSNEQGNNSAKYKLSISLHSQNRQRHHCSLVLLFFNLPNTWTITHFEIFQCISQQKWTRESLKWLYINQLSSYNLQFVEKNYYFAVFILLAPFNKTQFIRAQSLSFLWWCNRYSHLQWLMNNRYMLHTLIGRPHQKKQSKAPLLEN